MDDEVELGLEEGFTGLTIGEVDENDSEECSGAPDDSNNCWAIEKFNSLSQFNTNKRHCHYANLYANLDAGKYNNNNKLAMIAYSIVKNYCWILVNITIPWS